MWCRWGVPTLYKVKRVAVQALGIRVSYVRRSIPISNISGGAQRGLREPAGASEHSCVTTSLTLTLERHQMASAERLSVSEQRNAAAGESRRNFLGTSK